MLAFYDFPAEHWDHLRTTNPIESVFATVRHRTVRTKGSLSSTTAKLMVFKLVIAASKTWHRLKGENQLPKVIGGVRFQDGIEVIEVPANHAAWSTSSPILPHSSWLAQSVWAAARHRRGCSATRAAIRAAFGNTNGPASRPPYLPIQEWAVALSPCRKTEKR